MYPDPHIPSAPTERALEGGQVTGLPRRTLFLITSSIALVVLSLTALGVSVMQQAHLQAQRDKAERIEDSFAVSDHQDDVNEPTFSTRSYPTRMP